MGTQSQEESRGLMGTSFKWMFIAFNIMMAIIVYMSTGSSEDSSSVVKFLSGMGLTMLISMWVMGDIVLGAFTYFTRAKN